PFRVGFEAVGRTPLGDHLGEVTLELSQAKLRDVRSTDLAARWRDITGSIPGVVELTFRSESGTGGNAIDLELSGPNIEQLEAVSSEVKEQLNRYPWVADITD